MVQVKIFVTSGRSVDCGKNAQGLFNEWAARKDITVTHVSTCLEVVGNQGAVFTLTVAYVENAE